jgi:hypothetical protein
MRTRRRTTIGYCRVVESPARSVSASPVPAAGGTRAPGVGIIEVRIGEPAAALQLDRSFAVSRARLDPRATLMVLDGAR